MLTQRMQIQVVGRIVAELMCGPEEVPPAGPFLPGRPGLPRRSRAYRAEDFMPPYGEVWAALAALRPTLAGASSEARFRAVHDVLRGVLEQYEDGVSFYHGIVDNMPGYQPDAFALTTELASTCRPPARLWPGWLPMGMLSLLGSAPGVGKTYVALDLARRIIAGDQFPDGTPIPRALCPADVIYVDAEGIPGALIQRLQAWDLDVNRLHLMLPPGLPGGARTRGRGGRIDFARDDDRDHLTEMLAAYEPALVVVDSLGMITRRGEHDVEGLAEALCFLRARAADYGCAILLLHHARRRKPLLAGRELTLDDLRWSAYLVGQARSLLALALVQEGPEPDRNGPRRLEVVKANFGPNPPALGLRLLALVPPEAKPGGPGQAVANMCARLVYGPPPRQYVESQQPRASCAAWLAALLQDHPHGLPPAEILDLAATAGHTRSAVYPALLGARLASTGQHKRQLWRLLPAQVT